MAQFITAAGIDVSKAWLDVALWPDDAALLHIERSEAGCFDRLAAWLREHGVSNSVRAERGEFTEALAAHQAGGARVLADADEDALARRPRPRDGARLHLRQQLVIDPFGGSPQRKLAQRRQVGG